MLNPNLALMLARARQQELIELAERERLRSQVRHDGAGRRRRDARASYEKPTRDLRIARAARAAFARTPGR
jgi:hypothetical protein